MNKWERLASDLLKAELKKQRLKYPDLEKKLADMGENYGCSVIKQKLARGSFSFVFALQCLKAIGITNLNLQEHFEAHLKSVL